MIINFHHHDGFDNAPFYGIIVSRGNTEVKEETMIRDKMIALAKGTQLEACEVASKIHPDDITKANAFASEIGGWDIVAARFPELLAGAAEDERKGRLPDHWRITLLGVTALCRTQGHTLRL